MELPKEKSTVKNKSAVKALDVIEYLAACNNEPMRLQDIAAGLNMNVSTVLRFLTALCECGYAQQDPSTLRYYLTFKICSIANKVSSHVHLYDIALPIMKQIAAAYNESVCLAIEQDMTVIYVGLVPGPDQMLRTMQRIGNRAPMHCTGVGKLLLLNYSEEDIDRMIRNKGLVTFTQNTISTKEDLMQELKEVRRRGYAYDNEECEIGARCIAVPIRDYTHRIVACISVTGPIFRMTDEKLNQNMNYLIKQSRELSNMLGYYEDKEAYGRT
jgi:DNA-binding IclR family transcriptional regulator